MTTAPEASADLNVTVLGAGVMGAAIAAHFANAGVRTRLLDIVPEGETDRDALAARAIAGLKDRKPSPIVSEAALSLIQPGNIEDDLAEAAASSDWVVEAAPERLEIKQALYTKLECHARPECFISSNTSTIPISRLTEGRGESFKRRFAVTHFFNPPRYMRLLELVSGPETSAEALARVAAICDERLGKEVVPCRDTPGFIANRIGCFWLASGMIRAAELGVSPEEADAVLGKPFGVPKTGVFGLCDLIGVDLIPLIAEQFRQTLPATDPFLQLWGEGPAFVKTMIADGYLGRKGKGGFFRMQKGPDGAKQMQVRDLATGEYSAVKNPRPACLEAGKHSLAALMEESEPAARLANITMTETLIYACALLPEIAESVHDMDRAMVTGYNWKDGPLRLADKIGPAKLRAFAEAAHIPVPETLIAAEAAGGFYQKDAAGERVFSFPAREYQPLTSPPAQQGVRERSGGKKPVFANASAVLHDIGDGIACLEFRSKMNSVDPHILEALEQSVTLIPSGFKGLVIGNDADNFCVGANLGFLLLAANMSAWNDIDAIIARGQHAYMSLKYAPFPVVAAVAGMALGGGCELLLHADKVQAHVETYAGLVETGVGVIPGWGGCKEVIWRRCAVPSDAESKKEGGGLLGSMFAAASGAARSFNVMPVIKDAFETIAMAKVSESAQHAVQLGYLRETDGITMNRRRLIGDAKRACLELADGGYTPPRRDLTVKLPGKTAAVALNMAAQAMVMKGVATEYDAEIAAKLAHVLTGGNSSFGEELREDDLLKLEREAFAELIRNLKTLDRIEHMLDNGKPLRN